MPQDPIQSDIDFIFGQPATSERFEGSPRGALRQMSSLYDFLDTPFSFLPEDLTPKEGRHPHSQFLEGIYEGGKMFMGSPIRLAQSLTTGPIGQIGRRAASRAIPAADRFIRGTGAALDVAGGGRSLYEAGNEFGQGNLSAGALNLLGAGASLYGLKGDDVAKPLATSFGTERTLVKYPKPIKAGGVLITGSKVDLPRRPQLTNPTDAYQNWVNVREAGKERSFRTKEQWQHLDDFAQTQNMSGLEFFLKDPKALELKPLRDFFNQRYNELVHGSVKLNYKQDYLPQIWDFDAIKALSPNDRKRLTLKPTFTFESLLKNYEEGIQMGLKPKYSSLSDLAAYYDNATSRALADRQFFDSLRANGIIKPAGTKETSGWKPLPADIFPQTKLKNKKTGQETLVDWVVDPKAKIGNHGAFNAIENFARSGEAQSPHELGWWVEKTGQLSSATKNLALTAGIPKTGFNIHGFNILARHALTENNPVSGFITGAKYLANPKEASAFIRKNLDSAVFAKEGGLQLTAEDFDFSRKFLAKSHPERRNIVVEKMDELFADPLFREVIPALKLQKFNAIYEGLVKEAGPNPTANQLWTARKNAAQTTNEIFGGINWKELGQSREMQDTLRTFVLAPDWLKSNMRLAGNTVRALSFDANSPEYKQYRLLARNAVLGLLAANVMNVGSTGKPTFMNSPGHEFDINLGKDDTGRTRWLRPFGTSLDGARIPLQMAHLAFMGDMERASGVPLGRASIPVASIKDEMLGDYRGETLFRKGFGQQRTAPEVMTRGAQAFGDAFTPTPVRVPFEYLYKSFTGDPSRDSLEAAFAQSMEMPLGYSRDYVPPSDRNKRRRRQGVRIRD